MHSYGSVIYPPRDFKDPWSDKDSLHLNFLAWKEHEVSILLSVYHSRGWEIAPSRVAH
jgi:hypothetical protein